MGISVQGVGHVVLKGRDLERSVRFYRDVIGLKEVARLGARMAFFSAGENHHDLAVLEVGKDARLPLFVDTDPRIWRENPASGATVQPLQI